MINAKGEIRTRVSLCEPETFSLLQLRDRVFNAISGCPGLRRSDVIKKETKQKTNRSFEIFLAL